MATRKVAVLVAEGVDGELLAALAQGLRDQGATVHVVGAGLRPIPTKTNGGLKADLPVTATASVLHDAVAVLGLPEASDDPRVLPKAQEFLTVAYRHCKPLAFGPDAAAALADIPKRDPTGAEAGVVHLQGGKRTAATVQAFAKAILAHRHWNRTL